MSDLPGIYVIELNNTRQVLGEVIPKSTTSKLSYTLKDLMRSWMRSIGKNA